MFEAGLIAPLGEGGNRHKKAVNGDQWRLTNDDCRLTIADFYSPTSLLSAPCSLLFASLIVDMRNMIKDASDKVYKL